MRFKDLFMLCVPFTLVQKPAHLFVHVVMQQGRNCRLGYPL